MSRSASGEPLKDRGIVLTRPAGQNEALAALVRAAGGRPIIFPAITILDLDDRQPLERAIDRLDHYDFAIFVSVNAVDKTMRVLRTRRAWPLGVRAATVGLTSAGALRSYGVEEVMAPTDRYDSEALLDLPALAAVAGKRVIVFRGEAGRELLGETLRDRGATVDYVACYRRAKPHVDPAPLLHAWARGEIHAVTITSSEGLRNLFDMLGSAGAARVKATPLFAPHRRIAESARSLGCECVVETSPGDTGIVAALAAFWDTMPQQR
jgi:uroporphyrinogen-III synthase